MLIETNILFVQEMVKLKIRLLVLEILATYLILAGSFGLGLGYVYFRSQGYTVSYGMILLLFAIGIIPITLSSILNFLLFGPGYSEMMVSWLWVVTSLAGIITLVPGLYLLERARALFIPHTAT